MTAILKGFLHVGPVGQTAVAPPVLLEGSPARVSQINHPQGAAAAGGVS